MKEQIFKIYKKEMFIPGFIGLFINPFFIIRRGLYNAVKNNANKLEGKLLDFGCGSKPYRNLFSVDEYIGLDIESSRESDVNGVVDVFYDGGKIPFESDSFDSIFSSEVFEHVFELEYTLDEINRICKINGQLLITVPFVWDEHAIPYDYARFTSFGIKYLLEKKGFEVIKQTKTTTYLETVIQMWNAYIAQNILKNKILRVLLSPILIAPFTLISILLGKVLPDNEGFFHNNLVLAKKTTNL